MVQYGRLEEHPAWVMILVKVKKTKIKKKAKYKIQNTCFKDNLINSKVNHVLLTINSATNIVIYSYKASNSLSFIIYTQSMFILSSSSCLWAFIKFSQDFKFRTVIVSAFQRKRNFTSFRTSVRSSFGSSRYHTRYMQIRIFRNHNRYSHVHNAYLDTTQCTHKLR